VNIKFLFVFIIILFFISCTDDTADPPSVILDIELPMYYGTYLFNDVDCGGADIQYSTIDENGITFFDFLGDNCDDTVSCYATNTYELAELSPDTFLIVSEEGSIITNGEIYLDGDSAITLTYEGNNGTVEYSWEKIKDDIFSFTPACDQEYGYNKDIADGPGFIRNTAVRWRVYGVWNF